MENQDFASIASMAIGAAYFAHGAKKKDVLFSDLFAPYTRKKASMSTSQSGIMFRSLSNEAYEFTRALELSRAGSMQDLLQTSFQGMEEAVRMGILETMSRPSLQSRINARSSNAYQSVFQQVKGADAAGLKTQIDTLLKQFSDIDDFERELVSSIKSKTRISYKGQSYQSMLRGQAVDFTLGDMGVVSFSPTTILNRNQAMNMFGGQKGYFNQLESLVGRLEQKGLVGSNYMQTLFKQNRVFVNREGGAYARLKTRRGEINVPLGRNTMQTIAGEVPIYHADMLGTSRYSFVQNFFKFDPATKKLAVDKAGNLIRRSPEQAIFYDEDAAIFDVLDEAKKTSQSPMSILGGTGDFSPQERLRYAEYLTDDISGQMVAVNRQSMAVARGLALTGKNAEAMPSEVLGGIEQQLKEHGIKATVGSSPGAVGKLGAFDIIEANDDVNSLNLFSRAMEMSGARRPKQQLTRPYGISNIPQLMGTTFGSLDNGGLIYNPVNHPMLDTKTYSTMVSNSKKALQGMPGARGPRFSGFSAPTLFSLTDQALIPGVNVAEGVVARKPGGVVPEVATTPRVFNLARPSADFQTIKVGEGVKDLLKIADQYIDNPKARREALMRAAVKAEGGAAGNVGNKTFAENYYLGQKAGPRGLEDEFLDMRGGARLYDIESTETGYKLMFQKFKNVGSGSKMFGGIKGVIDETVSSQEMDAYFQKAGVGNLAARVNPYLTKMGELGKANQFAQLRGQQATGMRHLLGERLGMLGGGTTTNEALSMLSQAYSEGSPTGLFDRLKTRGAGLAASLGVSGSMQEELMGLVSMAYENRQALTDRDLGLIFGGERFKSGTLMQGGVLSGAYKGLGAQLGQGGEGFVNRLTASIAGAENIYGESLVFFRDEAGAFPGSRPRIERRAIENLINANAKSFVSLNGISERDILLSDIAAGVELPDKQFRSGLRNMRAAYKGGKFTSSISSLSALEPVGFKGASSQLVDLSSVLGEGSQVYVPSADEMYKLGTAVSTSNNLDPIEGAYGRSLSNMVEEINKFSSGLGDEGALAEALEAVRRQENVMSHKGASSVFRGRIMHSGYEMVGQRTDVTTFTDVGTGVTQKASEGYGQVATMSRAKAEALYERAISHFSGDEETRAELIRQKKLVMAGKARGAMTVMRSPTITERGRMLMAFRVDDTLDDDLIRMGTRVIGGEDGAMGYNVSALLAAANSADNDGDRIAYNLIAGKNSRAAFEAMQNDEILKKLALDRESHIMRHKAATDALTAKIDASIKGKPLTDFVGSMRKLVGQSDIGLLSYNIDRLKSAARVGMLVESGSQMSEMDYDVLEKLFYALEQEGVGFKHGENITARLTQDISAIFEMSDVGEAKKKLKTTLTDYFGNELFDEGFSYMEGGVEKRLKLSGQAIEGMTSGLAFQTSTAGRAVFDIARQKIEQVTRTKAAEYEKMIKTGATAKDMNALTSRMLDDIYEATDDLGLGGIGEINRRHHEAALARAGKAAGKLAPVAMGGLMLASGIYSLFDRGYSATELEAPAPGPDGRTGSSSIAMKMAIANGELLREERGGPSHNRGHNQQMPIGNTPVNMPPAPNSIPTKSYVEGNTSRINMQAMVPSGVNAQQYADSLRATMAHAQVGVNVTHRHVMPRDLTQEL